MKRLKMLLIIMGDWIDHRILKHRVYWICEWISVSPWWDYMEFQITYDLETDIINIRFGSKIIEESDEIAPNIIADYDVNGNIIGLEILDASGMTKQ